MFECNDNIKMINQTELKNYSDQIRDHFFLYLKMIETCGFVTQLQIMLLMNILMI